MKMSVLLGRNEDEEDCPMIYSFSETLFLGKIRTPFCYLFLLELTKL